MTLRKTRTRLGAALMIIALTPAVALAQSDSAKPDTTDFDPSAAPAHATRAAGVVDTSGIGAGLVTPIERIEIARKKAEKLRNPYTDDSVAIKRARPFFISTCAPCHGEGGGGGMCPPLSNEVWVYGSDDDVLFKLIALGSVDLQKLGYKRLRTETVVGPMPAHGEIVKSDTLLWKVMAYVRSMYRGNPTRRNW